MNTNALVIMARHPGGPDIKTRLSPRLDQEQRRQLYTKLLNGTVQRLRNIKDTDTMIACSPAESVEYFHDSFGLMVFPQPEGDLGQRLMAAVEHAFSVGHERVCVVGSDIPGLVPRIAADSFKALERADIALGPSTDGGYYLIGMSRLFPELFEGIPWSTSHVLKTTLIKTKKLNLSIEVLDILDDIDTPEDLERLGLV